MPTAGQWERLNPRYRARLERAGYTRADYLANRPRTSARGHGRTPEHPERARRNPERYQDYLEKRRITGGGGGPTRPVTQRERDELFDTMYDEFVRLLGLGTRRGGINRFDRSRLEFDIMNAPDPLFRYMQTLTVDQWRDHARQHYVGIGANEWYAITADEDMNPFFYH